MKHKTTKHGSARRANSQNSTLRMKTTYDDVLMRTNGWATTERPLSQSYRYWESRRGRGGSFVITPGVWRGWEKWIIRGTVGQASDAYRKSCFSFCIGQQTGQDGRQRVPFVCMLINRVEGE